MNRNEKRQALNKYMRTLDDLHGLELEREKIFTAATKLTQALDPIGGGHSSGAASKVENASIKLQELNKKIKRKKEYIDYINKAIKALKPYQQYLIISIDIKEISIHRFAKLNKKDYKRTISAHNKALDELGI